MSDFKDALLSAVIRNTVSKSKLWHHVAQLVSTVESILLTGRLYRKWWHYQAYKVTLSTVDSMTMDLYFQGMLSTVDSNMFQSYISNECYLLWIVLLCYKFMLSRNAIYGG